MMVVFISIYSGICFLLIIPMVRAVAIARDHARYPTFIELVIGGVSLSRKSHSSLRVAVFCSIGLVFFIFWGWKTGSIDSDIERGGISIFWAVTAYSLGAISFSLRSMYFNVVYRRCSMTAKEENKLFNSEIGFFPGFTDELRSLISLATLLALASLFIMLLTGI